MKKVLKHPDHSGGGSAAAVPVDASLGSLLRRRAADFCELAKLRISILVLLVTAIGYCVAGDSPIDSVRLLHTLLGTGLVAIAANTLNQVWERRYDAMMHRTRNRPIPSGRLSALEGFIFGVWCCVAGTVYLWLLASPLAAALAAVTFLLYVFVYTPLKRRTVHNTLIGAVPGALPPVIGYAAATGRIDALAVMLFGIVFVWQLPHFFAIAWMYREDYSRGGFRMLSVVDPTGRATRRQTLAYTVLLIAVSLAPALAGFAGPAFSIGAAALGAALLAVAKQMADQLSAVTARRMLLATVVYLPAVMLLLLMYRTT